MKKVEETIVIRNEKMIYAVRLKSKTEGEDGRRENNNPYLIVEGGKIKYIDHIMNLKECIGDTLQESATFLQNVRKFIGVGEK